MGGARNNSFRDYRSGSENVLLSRNLDANYIHVVHLPEERPS